MKLYSKPEIKKSFEPISLRVKNSTGKILWFPIDYNNGEIIAIYQVYDNDNGYSRLLDMICSCPNDLKVKNGLVINKSKFGWSTIKFL